MFSRLSIFTRFLVISSTLFVTLAIIFILASNFFIKNSFINRSKLIVSDAIQFEAKDLRPADFSLTDSDHAKKVFNDFYGRIKTPEIIRIKAWDYSGKVIFSDDESIIGKRFPENGEFKKAIKGDIVTEISETVKPENVSETGYKQLLEIYVPIIFRGESIPSGVIEVYFKLDDVNSRIKESQVIIIVIIGIFSLALFSLLFLIFKMIINKQIEKINLQAKALDSASEHVIITDPEGIILYVNKAAEKLTGYSKSEMVGKRPSLWGKQMPKEFYDNLWKTIKAGKSFKGEIKNKRKNGTEYQAQTEISPVLDKNNKVINFVGIERDITQEKAIDKAKTEFVSLASHQLRTPLTSINWYIEMLQSGDAGTLSDKQKEFLSEVYKGSKRMVQLVNDLLNVSRLETGRLKIEPVSTDLVAFISEVRKELEPQIRDTGCQISLELPENKIEKINVDQILLRQVIVNLITNAIRYSSKDKKGVVTVSLIVSPEKCTIQVKDNGIGIPKDVQPRIFEKFFRADNARTVVADGNGLGLYLAKQIMDSSGGTIGFDSKPGQGTTFYINIPLSGMKSKQGEKGLEG